MELPDLPTCLVVAVGAMLLAIAIIGDGSRHGDEE